MNLLLTFNFKEKVYCVYSKNNELIYGYQKEGVFFPDLLEEEKVLISLVISKLTPSTNVIELDDFTFNNKIFKRYLDIETNLTLFSKLVNNILVTPSIEETKHLNLLFNNQLEYVSLNSSIEELPFYKRLIKLGKEVIIVLVTTATVLSCLPTVANAATLNKDNNKSEITVNYDVEIEEIKRIIRTNPKLTEQEKKLSLENCTFLVDNKEFLEIDTIKENMKNLDFIYTPQRSADNLAGCYNIIGPKKYTIEFFNAAKLEDVKKSTFTHEFFHAFTFYNMNSIGIGLTESLNVMFNNEYNNKKSDDELYSYDTGYDYLRPYLMVLAETIDINALRKFHFNDDPKIIVNELTKIIPDEKMAYCLLYDMDTLLYLKRRPLEDKQQSKKILDETTKSLEDKLKKYYETKNMSKIEDNFELLFFYNNRQLMGKLNESLSLDENLDNRFSIPVEIKQGKYYFNRKFQNNDLIISVPTNGKVETAYFREEQITNNEIFEIIEKQKGKVLPYEITFDSKDKNKLLPIKWYKYEDFINIDVKSMSQKEEITRK